MNAALSKRPGLELHARSATRSDNRRWKHSDVPSLCPHHGAHLQVERKNGVRRKIDILSRCVLQYLQILRNCNGYVHQTRHRHAFLHGARAQAKVAAPPMCHRRREWNARSESRTYPQYLSCSCRSTGAFAALPAQVHSRVTFCSSAKFMSDPSRLQVTTTIHPSHRDYLRHHRSPHSADGRAFRS